MKIVTLTETQKPAELADRLSRKGTVTAKAMLAHLLVANPQLKEGEALPAGTSVLVPAEVATDSPELSEPGQQTLLAMVRQLQRAIPDVQKTLEAASAEGEKQQKDFQATLMERLGGQQKEVAAAEMRRRVNGVSKQTKLFAEQADESRALHAQTLKQVAKDLEGFLEQHAR